MTYNVYTYAYTNSTTTRLQEKIIKNTVNYSCVAYRNNTTVIHSSEMHSTNIHKISAPVM